MCDIGPYDFLYNRCIIVWPARPGRMVLGALKRLPRPGRALDLGCGDGKNIVFLERRGWVVDGLDVSKAARDAFVRRCKGSNHKHRGTYFIHDVNVWIAASERYSLVVCYGLLHCLRRDSDVARLLAKVKFTLKPGGIAALAVLNNGQPMPPGHGGEKMKLRRSQHYTAAFSRLRILSIMHGTIIEDHKPVISTHSHGVTWALLQKAR